jgi:hypothetical protein
METQPTTAAGTPYATSPRHGPTNGPQFVRSSRDALPIIVPGPLVPGPPDRILDNLPAETLPSGALPSPKGPASIISTLTRYGVGTGTSKFARRRLSINAGVAPTHDGWSYDDRWNAQSRVTGTPGNLSTLLLGSFR